jgi:hypothetical protein
MIYDIFFESNNLGAEQAVVSNKLISSSDDQIVSLFSECGGYSFNKGLYRIHHPESSLHWSILLADYFPKYKGRIIPFGYDWMGKQFCLDTGRKDYILLFDLATAKDFELNQNIVLFHNNDLIYEKEEVLSEQLFDQVLDEFSLKKLAYTECVTHKTPLFLGGKDNVSNYEVSDLEVCWEMQFQIYRQIKDLPEGTKINSIKFNK